MGPVNLRARHGRLRLGDPADLRRGREPRGRRRRHPRGACPRRTSSSSTTTRATARASSPTRWRADDRRRGPAPPRQGRASGAPTPPASRTRSPRGAGYVVEMDADLSHDPADLPRLIAPALRRRRPRARLALRRTAAGSRTGACERRVLSLAGLRATRGACSASACATSPAASSASAPSALRAIDAETRRRPGLRLPGRADLARAARSACRSSRCRSASASGGSANPRCPRSIALEAAWRVPALRYGPRRWRPLEADRATCRSIGA